MPDITKNHIKIGLECLIFKAFVMHNRLMIEDELLEIYTRLQARLSVNMLHLWEKCAKYGGFNIRCLYALMCISLKYRRIGPKGGSLAVFWLTL